MLASSERGRLRDLSYYYYMRIHYTDRLRTTPLQILTLSLSLSLCGLIARPFIPFSGGTHDEKNPLAATENLIPIQARAGVNLFCSENGRTSVKGRAEF